MERQQNYWESLQRKYEEKNKALQKRECELRHKLEAMNAIIGDSGKKPVIQIQPTAPQIPPAAFADFKSCTCPPPVPPICPPLVPQPAVSVPPPAVEDGTSSGFFKCVFSLFGSSKHKSVPVPPPSVSSTPQNMAMKEDIQVNKDVTSTVEADQQSYRGSIHSQRAETPTSKREVDQQSCRDSICSRRAQLQTLRRPVEDNESCICSTCSEYIDSPNIKNTTIATTYKNENCMCNPCMADEPAPQKDDDVCSCSICTVGSNKNDDSLCACSICSKMSGNKDYCCCNYGKVDFQNNSASKIITQAPIPPASLNAGQMSLQSMDLFYMKNVHDLATHQKDLVKEINVLEEKARIYEEVFNQYKNVDFAEKERYVQGANHNLGTEEQKITAELKLENFLLKNELKDMRLEVRQYLERMESPMQFKIESERYKRRQLELQLEDAAKKLVETQQLYQKEINTLKMHLMAANTEVYNLTTTNEKLKTELQETTAKCVELHEDLVRQKISEGATIQRLQAQLTLAQNNTLVEKDECDLHVIARELSKILKECEPCGDCMNLPEDLTSAAMLLKTLTDLIESKLPTTEEGSYWEKEKGEGREPSVRTQPEKAALNEETVSKKSGVGTEQRDQKSVKSTNESTQQSQASPEEQKSVRSGTHEDQIAQAEQKSVTSEKESIARQSQTEQGDQKSVKSAKESIGHKSQTDQGEQKSIRSGKESMGHQSQTDQGEQKSVKSGKESVGHQSQSDDQGEQKSVKSGHQSQTDQGEQKSVKSGRGSIGQQGQNEEGEQKSVKSGRGSVGHQSQLDQVEEKSVKSAKESVARQSPIDPHSEISPRRKVSCICVEPRRKTPEREPISEAEGKRKRSCDCSVKKSKESKSSSSKRCKCGKSKSRPEPASALASSSSKRSCKCKGKSTEIAELTPDDVVALPVGGDGVDQLWPKDSGRFKLSHQVTASKSRELLQSETSIKCLRTKENFPFDVDTQVDILNKPPDGVHVTTTITNSGTLEVITEGPEGVIETTLIYTNSGNVEVVTEVLEYKGKGRGCNRGRVTATSPGRDQKAIEGPVLKPTASEPTKTTELITVADDATTNPNCQCIECPGLEGMSPTLGVEPILKTSTSEPAKTPTPLEEKDDVTPVQIDQGGPKLVNPDCVCIECPGLEPMPQSETSGAPAEMGPKAEEKTPQELPQEAPTQAEAVVPENNDELGTQLPAATADVSGQPVEEGAVAEVPNSEVTDGTKPLSNMAENIEINQHITESSLAVSIHGENPDGPDGPQTTE